MHVLLIGSLSLGFHNTFLTRYMFQKGVGGGGGGGGGGGAVD